MSRLNKAELSEREKRELWAAEQLKAAKRNWRLTGYVFAALVLLLAGFAWKESGYWQGWRDCRESISCKRSAERKTP